jgi:hypothetical protein
VVREGGDPVTGPSPGGTSTASFFGPLPLLLFFFYHPPPLSDSSVYGSTLFSEDNVSTLFEDIISILSDDGIPIFSEDAISYFLCLLLQ